ncbi:HelD family protein [Antrihabitans stalactiti]|uniref:Helicase n=1 Tax=Antrihabitans stalactiti TaxID=2584121 RepID=A0A848KEI5_9NOCA|nr:ATP-binding domain-containing protein [Antrihabitans stalactiti]NMN95132.1 helicase [Antrihabitans stalactiti]
MPEDGQSALDREQAYVSMLYQQLDTMRAYASTRLSKVLLETGGTPQARSERESFSQMYAEDLAKYDAAENGLCFGRIDLDDLEERYIGRIGVLDEKNDFETLLLDWRAPLARPFYLATTAAPDGVTRRRHIRTRSRRVTSINDEYLDLDAAESAGRIDGGSVGTESALLAALNAARTGHMNDIVETIQGEQDAIIRSDHKSVLVVQGGPGTGKTAVALHRAAYLLYTYRQQLAKSGVLIIGPNATFLDYIGQVLPSLGETGVLLSTIGDLYPGVRASREDTIRGGELKGSLAMIDILRNAVRDRQELPETAVPLRFDSVTVLLDRRIVTRARGRARSSRRPHNLARPIFVSSIIDSLADQVVIALGENVVGGANLLSRDDIADIRDELRSDPEVMGAIGRLWPELSPQDVLIELLSSPTRLATAAPDLTDDDRASLLLGDEWSFSAADAPLLDELAELLGVDDAEEKERADRRWRAQIADAQGALDILTGSAPQDLEDEVDPEILMAYDLIDASQLAQRQSTGTRLTTAERAAGDRTWTYGHVIVDEAQELSELAWRMVMRRIPNRWITVVGDVAQTGDPAGTSSWQRILEPYVARRWKLAELTVNYRTPAEIMDVAEDVLAAIDPEATIPRSIRNSGAPPWVERVDEDDLEAAVRRHVAAETGPGISAVIAGHDLRARLAGLESDTVSVLTVRDVKGLEFDSVFIVDPQHILDESPRGMNDLYVALTRATQRLGVIHSQELPAVLERVHAVTR